MRQERPRHPQASAAAPRPPRQRIAATSPGPLIDLPRAGTRPSLVPTWGDRLPIPLSSFVGRRQELAELCGLLAATRLLTLTGSGGVGKTRLAIQLASEVRETLRDGVAFVDLAPIGDPHLVAVALAHALDLREVGAQPLLERLQRFLGDKQVLLVLDNAEHLVAACADLVERLLSASPGLQVLVTGRQPLGLVGEIAWPVPPLALPDPRQPAAVDQLADCEAIRLFLERAAEVRPGFALTPDNGAAIADLCRRLDGIPLAIELAAARLRTLSAEQIAARLGDRFRLLTGGSRAAAPRQRTLRGMVDWSYELLEPAEQALFRRLAAFAGGWTLEAAEAVCADEDVAAHAVLDLLGRLVEQSLVLADEQQGVMRYRFLETVREYARERLREAGEERLLRARQRDWVLALAAEAETELRGPRQADWLDRLEAEHDNLRQALDWCASEPGEAEVGLQIATAVWWFWLVRGHVPEGRQWLTALLARTEASGATLARTRALSAGAFLVGVQLDAVATQTLASRGLALARALGDPRGLAWALAAAGLSALYQGDGPAAGALCEEGLQAARVADDGWGLLFSVYVLGMVALTQQAPARAVAISEQLLARGRERRDAWFVALAQFMLGILAWAQGNAAGALAYQREALECAVRLGDRQGFFAALEALGLLAADRGEPLRATRLLGAAEAAREAIGTALPFLFLAGHERVVARLRATLGEAGLAAAWSRGATLPTAQVVELALATDGDLAPNADAPRALPADSLTRREREVAALVAGGLTNRQIAERLVIGERTVHTHVEHILEKLGCATRAQVKERLGG